MNATFHQGVDCLEKLLGFVRPPINAIIGFSKVHVVVQMGVRHFPFHVFQGVDEAYPTVAVPHIFVPLLVIGIVVAVEIQYILTDGNVFIDAVMRVVVNDLPFQVHDVVVHTIVPFANQLQDGVTGVVFYKQDLGVQGIRPEGIPLRVDKVIVHLIMELELVVYAPVEGRAFVSRRIVFSLPAPVWFYIVHPLFIQTAYKKS